MHGKKTGILLAEIVALACLTAHTLAQETAHGEAEFALDGVQPAIVATSSEIADLPDLVDCLAGPGALPAPTGSLSGQQCLDLFDFNTDNDVDLGDSAVWLQVAQDCPVEFRDCATGDCLAELACFGQGTCSDDACACDEGWIGSRCSLACDGGAGVSYCFAGGGGACGGRGLCDCDGPVNDPYGSDVQCCRCLCDQVTPGFPYVGDHCECAGSGARIGNTPNSSVEYQAAYTCDNPFFPTCDPEPQDLIWGQTAERTFEIWFRINDQFGWNVPLLSKFGCPLSEGMNCHTKSMNWAITLGNVESADGSRQLHFGSEGNWVTSAPFSAGTRTLWHHAAVVVRDEPGSPNHTVEMYLDGVVGVVRSGWESQGPPNDGPIAVGRYDRPLGVPSTYFVGDIVEVRMWDHARTPAQIADNMHNKITDPVELSKLLLYVKFDEQNTVPQTAPVDYSSSNLPVTLLGDVEYEILSPVFDPNDPSTQLCNNADP